MRILVIRHAIAMDREDFQRKSKLRAKKMGARAGEANDDLRPLTADGIKKMKRNAKGLVALSEKPGILVTSPLTRAEQTAEIVRDAWGDLEMAICEFLRPGSDHDELSKWLLQQPQGTARKGLIAVVGHEPHLSSMTSWFLTGSPKSLFELKKGGACLLDFPTKLERGRGKLLWLLTPSQLTLAK